jgi:hypothetical protein
MPNISKAEYDALRKAVESTNAILDGDEECRFDHHGYCQAHNLGSADECWAKAVKDAMKFIK